MEGLEHFVKAAEVQVGDRVRKDFGDLDELCNSIRTVGLIQPIVLTRDLRLIAGERRLRALSKLGLAELTHAVHFVYNDELDDIRLKAMECEENLKRKALSWQEEILAKKRLLELMVSIHGQAQAGHPTHSEVIGASDPGFGINKLASLLGESNAQTSKDIELAKLIEAAPVLAQADTKEAARRQALLAIAVAGALQQQAQNPPKMDKNWTLWEGDFIKNALNIPDTTCDFICVDPPYGEDAVGMGPNSKQLLSRPFEDSFAETELLIGALARHSFRVLRQDRFACFFFGFRVYPALVAALRAEGFEVDTTPLVWVKNTVINTTPYTRYGRSYEPILIARKGEPRLIRPSQRDVITLQNVTVRSTGEQKYYHAQKPLELMQKLVEDMCVPGGMVVDFCAGSGSTGEAALRSKRKVYLFELDPVACKIINARLGGL